MKTQEIKIEGMSCSHCAMAVRKELSKIHDVKVSDVQIGSAKVEYDESKVTFKELETAIENAGYKVINN